jgi:hypothetical protein
MRAARILAPRRPIVYESPILRGAPRGAGTETT